MIRLALLLILLLTLLLILPLQVGMGQMECYERDFEEHLLSDTADYYRRNAAQWIMQDSCPAYMIKVRCSNSLTPLQPSS
jgi:hypothetical protein